jgi:hypothetical protein
MDNLAAVLSLLPPDVRAQPRAWAAYSILFLPLAANAAGVKGSVTTSDGSSFILTRIKAVCTTNAAPPVENATPQATFTLSIGSLNLFPDGNPQHLQAYAVSSGDRRGHVLEFPTLVDGNTALTCLMTNLTATDFMVRLHLYGIRTWKGPRSASAI